MGVVEPVHFLRETFQNFRTTGAVAPSSRFLSSAMVRAFPKRGHAPADFRVLEVGPGTGPFTKQIVKRLGGRGRLDLWEISPLFVERLQKRFEKEKVFRETTTKLHLNLGDIMQLPAKPTYDFIVSGLPFNNFTPHEVEGFLEHFRKLLKPGGHLTYFEYVAVRKIQKPFVGKARRDRIAGIERVVSRFAKAYQVRSELVPINIPPARVRHFCFQP